MALALIEYLVLACMIYILMYVGAVSLILFIYIRNWLIISWSYYSSPPPPPPPPPRSCCRVKNSDISSSKLSSLDDECRNGSSIKGYCSSSMYILVSLQLDGQAGFALYRIDALHHLQPTNNTHDHLNELDPLLFFPNTDPDFDHYTQRSCVKFGSKLYFFGLDYYFGTDDSATTSNVYTVEEEVLKAIEPSLYNDIRNFRQLFTKTKYPMHGRKNSPIFFAANQKLYVLSQQSTTGNIFEVFSPSDETWQVLPFPCNTALGVLASLVVLKEQEQLVYFSDGEDILSFNLETHEWITPPPYSDVYEDYKYDYNYSSSGYSTFQEKPVSIIGDMAFGFRYSNKSDSNYVCASQTISGGEELMKPSLAPDQAFLEDLRSSRFTYINKDPREYSDCLVALQDVGGKQVLCIVTYGSGTNPLICNTPAYVTLSFFDIPGDFFTLKDSPVQEDDATYADHRDEDGVVVRRHFSAKYRHTAQFIINNSNVFNRNELVACFS